MSQRGTSCANLYAVAVQHDKLYNALHCKSKKYAFTLAEVLITLVIIGIIAALTIPNLLQKYQEQATVKKVQKFYSNLSNAYALASKENGPMSEWGLVNWSTESAEKVYETLFKPYFKIAKNCRVNNTGKCIISGYYKGLNNNNSATYAGGTAYYKIALDDGSALWFSVNVGVYVFYDTNGIKGPNQWGKDLFYYVINDKRVSPIGAPKSGAYYPILRNSDCRKSGEGRTCAGWVVYKGNMDYLHCDGLDWNGKDKCK